MKYLKLCLILLSLALLAAGPFSYWLFTDTIYEQVVFEWDKAAICCGLAAAQAVSWTVTTLLVEKRRYLLLTPTLVSAAWWLYRCIDEIPHFLYLLIREGWISGINFGALCVTLTANAAVSVCLVCFIAALTVKAAVKGRKDREHD